MRENPNIVRHSSSEVRVKREHGEDETSPDAPEAESYGTDFWSTARAVLYSTNHES